jgi:hypothetical protein
MIEVHANPVLCARDVGGICAAPDDCGHDYCVAIGSAGLSGHYNAVTNCDSSVFGETLVYCNRSVLPLKDEKGGEGRYQH